MPMRLFIALLIFPVAAVLHAEDETQAVVRFYADVEARIAGAVVASDQIVVEAVVSPSARRLIWQSTQEADRLRLAAAFKLKPPVIVKTMVNGKEEMGIRATSCFCYGQLWITFKKQDEVLLSLLIKHGQEVATEKLGGYDVEAAPLAPFHKEMMALAENARPASPPPAPGPGQPRPAHP